MAAGREAQLTKICSDPETLAEAKELFNIAKVKTGPGSGRDLGPNAIGLPAICALLACEVLGTTDVTEKIAQQTSCLAPKNFRNAYAIVKSALTVTLQKRRQRNASFEYLVESHGLSEDLIPWMKKVYAVLQKSGELDEMRASENAVVCSVFYWVCVASHIRTVKRQTLAADYHYPPMEGERIFRILDELCEDIQDQIGKQSSQERASRNALPSPTKMSRMELSPTKSPTKRSVGMRIGTGPLLKRRPSMPDGLATPSKRPREVTLQEVDDTPVTTRTYTRQSSPDSPTKAYERLEDTPMKAIRLDLTQVSLAERSSPMLAQKKSGGRVPKSPEKRAGGKSDKRIWKQASRPSGSDAEEDVEMDDATRIAEQDSSNDDHHQSGRRCRRHPAPFLDRLFWFSRDPLIEKEWDKAERAYQALLKA